MLKPRPPVPVLLIALAIFAGFAIGISLRPGQTTLAPVVPASIAKQDPESVALATPARSGVRMRLLPPSHAELTQIEHRFRTLGPRLPFHDDRMEFAYFSLSDAYEAYRRWPPVIGEGPTYYFRAIPRLSRPPALGNTSVGVLILEDPLLGPGEGSQVEDAAGTLTTTTTTTSSSTSTSSGVPVGPTSTPGD